jgi:RsiW-degrading membrane proteinase PrsW (M82 family)
MQWFYVIKDQRRGPVTQSELGDLKTRGVIDEYTYVWRMGMSKWERVGAIPDLFPAPAAPDSVFRRASRRINELTDTEAVDSSHMKGLFREVGRRHTPDEIEAVFAVGQATTTPDLATVSTTLPSPWVFTRLLSFLGVAFLALSFGWAQWKNPNLIPGVILLGSFTMPLVTAVFLFECNSPKNISLFAVMRLFVWGGVLSLLAALVLFDITAFFGNRIGPPIAGFVEEPAKLLAVIMLGSLPRYRWTLNGMCLGAAVGAGFAAFESAGYALLVLVEGGTVSDMFTNLYLRGILAPFGHVVWTAIAAGAVWRVKGDRSFEMEMLKDKRVLAPILAVMVLHATWNSELPSLLPFPIGYLVLGAVGWIIAIGMLLGGLRELRGVEPTS